MYDCFVLYDDGDMKSDSGFTDRVSRARCVKTHTELLLFLFSLAKKKVHIDSSTEREAARNETISYAAYVLLAHRFKDSVEVAIQTKRRLGLLDFEPAIAEKDVLHETAKQNTPAGRGIKLALDRIERDKNDGACEANDYQCELSDGTPFCMYIHTRNMIH
jgi:hypothetical protein